MSRDEKIRNIDVMLHAADIATVEAIENVLSRLIDDTGRKKKKVIDLFVSLF